MARTDSRAALHSDIPTTARPGARGALLLSWILVALMTVQSSAGLLASSLYRDAEWAKAAWFGNDIVTLVVAVPLLVIALMLTRRSSARAELVWFAMLGYGVYNYAYYVFGARMNALFPLYVVLFALSVVALALALGRFDASAVVRGFSSRTPVRWIAGYMMFTGVGLSMAWLAQWAAFVFGGVEPSVGEEAFSLIAALDLTLMVPYFALGAVLLWRRHPWGYVLGAIMNVKGATYTLVLTVSSTVAAARGIEGSAGQIPVWGVWTLVGAGAALALFSGLTGRDAR